jgi:hypothetical protein
MLLAHQYWRTQVAADPQVLGRQIQVNNFVQESLLQFFMTRSGVVIILPE